MYHVFSSKMMLSRSSHVGCGYKECPGTAYLQRYVCNYAFQWVYIYTRYVCNYYFQWIHVSTLCEQLCLPVSTCIHDMWATMPYSASKLCLKLCLPMSTCVLMNAYSVMASSNGNSFRVTDHLCGELTGPRWFPRTKASDAGLWGFLWFAPG